MTSTRRPPPKAPPSRQRSAARSPARSGKSRRRVAARVRPRRLLLLVAIFVAFAAGLIFQLVRIQALSGERYLSYGESQRFRSVELTGDRGRILDRSGVALAVSLPAPTIYVDPRLITDPKGAAESLAPLVGIDSARLEARFSKADSSFAYVARQVSEETEQKILALNIPGVFSIEESKRFSPLGDTFARSVLGRVDVDQVGSSGIELAYTSELRGTPGRLSFERAKAGNAIPGGVYDITEAVAGDDVQISIDRTLQFETERLLVQQVDAANADSGVVIISKPATGEILAMASVGRDSSNSAVVVGENRALTWFYEPGSVMKPITFAGVFEAGLAELTSATDVPFKKTIYDKDFTDDHFHETAWWTPVDILRESSNIGTIQWAEKLGSNALHDNLQAFGFGQRSTLAFPHESPGILRPVESWSGTGLPSISIGQGIAATPMQVLQAYNIIANDGVYVPPKLVLGTIASDGELREPPYEPSRRIIEETTAQKLTAMMQSVVESGTGRAAAIPGYRSAGKTGTSWKPQPGGGYTDIDGGFHYVATFAGFLPADDPAVSILVVIDEPRGSDGEISGGKAAAPLFAKLSRYALQHLRVPPSIGSTGTSSERIRTETELERRQRERDEAAAEVALAEALAAKAGKGSPDEEGSREPDPTEAIEPEASVDASE